MRIAKKRRLGITSKTAFFCCGSERTLHGKAAAEEMGVRPNLVYCVIAHRFCCPCAPLYFARKGMYARETLAGFSLHVKSPARRRPLLRSKSAAPKRKTPLRVSSFLERATRLAGGPAGPPHAHGHQNMPPACFSRCARALSSLCPT